MIGDLLLSAVVVNISGNITLVPMNVRTSSDMTLEGMADSSTKYHIIYLFFSLHFTLETVRYAPAEDDFR